MLMEHSSFRSTTDAFDHMGHPLPNPPRELLLVDPSVGYYSHHSHLPSLQRQYSQPPVPSGSAYSSANSSPIDPKGLPLPLVPDRLPPARNPSIFPPLFLHSHIPPPPTSNRLPPSAHVSPVPGSSLPLLRPEDVAAQKKATDEERKAKHREAQRRFVQRKKDEMLHLKQLALELEMQYKVLTLVRECVNLVQDNEDMSKKIEEVEASVAKARQSRRTEDAIIKEEQKHNGKLEGEDDSKATVKTEEDPNALIPKEFRHTRWAFEW